MHDQLDGLTQVDLKNLFTSTDRIPKFLNQNIELRFIILESYQKGCLDMRKLNPSPVTSDLCRTVKQRLPARRRQERGVVAVEFALSAPILIAVFMVMMFLMDLMMVKQEITSVGFTAMRECSSSPNQSECVLTMIGQAQTLAGSNARYSCDAGLSQAVGSEGATFQVVNLQCEYQGFTPIQGILNLTGLDLQDALEFKIPVFFPEN